MLAGLNAPLSPLRFLERSATAYPDRTACKDGPRSFTFAQMKADAEAMARGLLQRGLRPVSYTHLTLPTTLHECRSRWSPYH